MVSTRSEKTTCAATRLFSSSWYLRARKSPYALRPVTSVEDGIYAQGKVHIRSIPSLRSFPSVAFEFVPMLVWLTMALSRLFRWRSSSACSFYASLRCTLISSTSTTTTTWTTTTNNNNNPPKISADVRCLCLAFTTPWYVFAANTDENAIITGAPLKFVPGKISSRVQVFVVVVGLFVIRHSY